MLSVYILHLCHILKDPDKWVQVWYANHASACAKLEALCIWFDLLMLKGSAYGSFPEPEKSPLVVHENTQHIYTKGMLDDVGIKVVTNQNIVRGSHRG